MKIKKNKDLPGYPPYPSEEDIFEKEKETELDLENSSKTKPYGKKKGPDKFKSDDDKYGSDLDIPGAELDDESEETGSEDEENNYYSLGGDDHSDLDEEK